MNDQNFPKETLYNVGVKAAIINDQREILLLNITRKNSSDTYWDLPGGRIVDGETPEQTLRREVQEETGISELTVNRHLIMATGGVRLPIFSTKKVGVVFSVYICSSNSTVSTPEERITMHWMALDEAVKALKTNPDWPPEIIAAVEQL